MVGSRTGVWSEAAGDPSEPALLLIHGSMDRAAGLLRLSRRLDGEFHAVRFDRRGYGRSQTIGPPWTIAANIDDAEALAEPLVERSGRPLTIIGHSFGGDVAFALAERRPELVGSIVVYETPLSWLDWWPRDSAGAAAVAASSPEEAAEAFMRRLVGDAVWERLPAGTQADRRSEGRAMVAELADLRRAAPWSPMSIRVPVLALCGESARPHHRRGTEWLAAEIVDCTVRTIAGAGHAGPHTHPGAVAAEVFDFVRSPVNDRGVAG